MEIWSVRISKFVENVIGWAKVILAVGSIVAVIAFVYWLDRVRFFY